MNQITVVETVNPNSRRTCLFQMWDLFRTESNLHIRREVVLEAGERKLVYL